VIAAAAITGGNPFRTTMLSWKYVTPAFLVPFVFTLSPGGGGVLLQGTAVHIITTSAAAVFGIAALSLAISGFVHRRLSLVERLLLVAGGGLLFFPQPLAKLTGIAMAAVIVASHWRRSG
jgi:TRAP-type uncharacterized transport system fused permease subunit